MGYCFMTIEKVKSYGCLNNKCNHNYRKVDVPNADPALYYKNEELIKSKPNSNGEKDLVYAFKERINELDYYTKHKIRKDSVLAFEVVTTFSRESNIDIEEWKKRNVEWLQKSFNKAGDGGNNIISCVYHADEPGNVHCHAIVVPINKDNRLSAYSYVNQKKSLIELQNSYAEDMEDLGLERGIRGSRAKHKDIKKFYASLNQAIKDIPEPKPDELAIDYKNRFIEEIETVRAALLREETNERNKKLRELEKLKIELYQKADDKYDNKVNEFNKAYSESIEKYKHINERFEALHIKEQSLNQKEESLNIKEEWLNELATHRGDQNLNYEISKLFSDNIKKIRESEPEIAKEYDCIRERYEVEKQNETQTVINNSNEIQK